MNVRKRRIIVTRVPLVLTSEVLTIAPAVRGTLEMALLVTDMQVSISLKKNE